MNKKLEWSDLLRKYLSERTEIKPMTPASEDSYLTMGLETYAENPIPEEFLSEFLQEVSMLRTGQPHWNNPMCMPGNDTVH